jgi:hypothetical protein
LCVDLTAGRLALQQHFNDTRGQSKVSLNLKELPWSGAELTEHVVETVVRDHPVCEFPGLLSIGHTGPEIDSPCIRPAGALADAAAFQQLAVALRHKMVTRNNFSFSLSITT